MSFRPDPARNPETLDEFIEVAEQIMADPNVLSFSQAPGTSWGGPMFLLHFVTALAKELRNGAPEGGP